MTTGKTYTINDFDAETQEELKWLAMGRGTHPITSNTGETVWVTPRDAEKLRAGQSIICAVTR